MRFSHLAVPVWLAALACSSSSGGSSGGLTGPKAFTVSSTVFSTGYLGCGSPILSGGSYDGVTVVLSDAPVSALVCGDTSGGSDAGAPHILEIQVATDGYWGGGAKTPLAVGVAYPILNEGVNDEDLCGNVPRGTKGARAIVMYSTCAGRGQCSTSLWAVSGSVTFTSLSSSSVAGSFQIGLGSSSKSDASAGPLSGTFSAASCSG